MGVLSLWTIVDQLSPKPYLYNLYTPSTWTLNPIVSPIPTTTNSPIPNGTTNSKVLGLRGELCIKCCSSKIEAILSFDILEPLVKADHRCESEGYIKLQNMPNSSVVRKVSMYHL